VGFNISFWYTCVSTGSILGPELGGYLSKAYGYPTVFYTSSVILVATASILFFTGRKLVTDEKIKKQVKILENMKSVLRNSQIRLTFIMAFLVFLGVSSVRSFSPIYASELFSMDEISVGLMITLGSAMQLIMAPFVGRLSDKYSVRGLLMILLAVSGVLFLVIRVADTPIQVMLITIGLLMSFSSQSVSLIIVSKLASREKLGATMGLYSSFEDLGLIIGPLVFGYVWEVYGARNIYLIASLAAFIAIILLSQTKLGIKQ
jgi:predicted MFS family arabinose efflux permease